MDIPVFDFLEGISPWWWVAFGVALGAVEMATMSFFLIWPALAALLMAFILWIAPGMSGEAQIMIFAIASVALTFLGRSVLNRYGDGGAPETALNKRSEQLVGRRAKVLMSDGHEGSVEIDGVRWRAKWDARHNGATHVKIDAADGMTLSVSDVI